MNMKNSDFCSKCSHLLAYYKKRYQLVQRGLSYIVDYRKRNMTVSGQYIGICKFVITSDRKHEHYIIAKNVDLLVAEIEKNYNELCNNCTSIGFFKLLSKF